MPLSIAIDGPSASGKSTLAKALAEKYGFIYIDTGALYRTVGLYVHELCLSSQDAEAIVAALPEIHIEMQLRDGRGEVYLNGRPVGDEIRTPVCSLYASDVSKLPEVRAFLLSLQRDIAAKHNVVMDGRDIGTVILPDADVKLFMSASDEERARRRWRELNFAWVKKLQQQTDPDKPARGGCPKVLDTSVIIDGRIPNPTPDNLSYFNEMMGSGFQMDRDFLSQRLKKWLPRMTDGQRDAVVTAMYATLDDMRRAGKNDNMLRNAYMKYMCWLYYKFERIVNVLGGETLPKILYAGDVSHYELQLLTVLSRAGADIVLLECGGDQAYLTVDPQSALSHLYQAPGLGSFPAGFGVKQLQAELEGQGVQFTTPDLEPFRAAVQPIYDNYADKETLGKVQAALGRQ